jgi:hypothetical protein
MLPRPWEELASVFPFYCERAESALLEPAGNSRAIGFVPSGKISKSTAALRQKRIRDSPEIGFVLESSRVPAISDQPKGNASNARSFSPNGR